MEIQMKRFFQRAALLFFMSFLWASSSWAQANVVGQWVTLPYRMPINPVHSALLNNGKVLIVSGSGWVVGNTNYLAAVWDPIAGTITQQSITWDMFCAGISILPDGRPMIVSGTATYDPFYGLKNTAVYSPVTGQFTNMQNLAHGRWYPTTTILGDGRLLTFSGLTETGATNSTIEIYTVGTGWSPQYASPFTPPLYPWLHLLPNGNVFFSGSSPISAIFNPTSNTWTTNVATTNYGGTRTYGTSVLLPLTPANGYKPVVMIMGGANPATATTELIDLSVSNPKWVYGPSMSQARIEMSAAILPSGKILALGGSVNDEDSNTAGLKADLYDPVSNTFSAAGTNAYPHLYHSVALLLPDATVMITGGNPQRGSVETHMEVYSPAYLFTTNGSGQVVPAVRPTISSVSSSTLNYGGAFQVQTPDAANISSVVLIRPGADTHAFNFDQRLVGLSFSAGSGVLNVTAPPNSNIAPPGYYMMFLLNASGVPSVAQFVQLPVTGSIQPPSGAITSPATNVTIGAGQSVSFSGTGTDPNPNGSITGYSWVFPGGTPGTSAVQNPGAVTFSAVGTDVVSLTVTDNNNLSDPNPPTRTIAVVPNFALSATPASQSTPEGSGASYTTTVTPGTGFTGTVSLSVSGLPTGATASFSPASITGSGSSTLNVTTAATTPTGTFTLTISGTGGGLTQTTTVSLVVNATVDFSLSTSPASQNVIQGNSTSFTSTATSLGGFSGSIAFSVSGLPAGVTGTFTPASVTGSGSTTLNLSTTATATTGAYTITVTGTSGSLTHSSTANLLVLSSSGPTLLSLAVTPANSSILAGGTQQFTATGSYSDTSTQNLTSSVTWTSSTPGAATINAAGLATGVAAGSTTIQAATGSISGSTPLTVAATLPGLVGHWSFDAASGTTAADTSGNGYTATLFNGVTWVPGKIGNAISANTTNQYASTGSINLSATNAVTVSLWVNRTYTTGGTNGTTLYEFSNNYNNYNNVFAFFPDEAADCGVAAMEIAIDGNSGYNIKCYTQPTSAVWHHLAVVYDMSQAAANEVNLYIDGILQTALKQTYSSNNTGNFGNYPFYLFSRAGTASYSGGQMDDLQLYNRALSASEILQIFGGTTSSPDFALASSPTSQTVVQGASTTYTPTITPANGFSGAVALSVSGLPTGATGTFNPTSVTGSGTSTLTVATAATTLTGTYPLTITGTSGTLTHSATATLVVNVPPDFTLTASPGSQTVTQGGSTSYTSTATSTGGFSGSILFSISGLPSGVTGTFSPTSVTGSGSTTLNLVSTSTATTGTYTLTITGTSGSLTHSATTSLAVQSSSGPTLTSLTVTPANQSIAMGTAQQFTAMGTYSDSSTQNLTSSATWASNNTAAATINSAGLATGIAGGSATIQASSASITGSTTLTVTNPTTGLVGHWTFDDGSGTVAADSSGNAHDATLFNGVTWVTGKIGGAISANATNQYASTASINLTATNAVTASMWVNRTYTTGGTSGTTLFEFSNNYNDNSGSFGFFPDEAADCGTSAMEIGIDGNAGHNIKCFAQPTSGVWHHLAVVFDSSQTAANEVNLYVDGVLQTALSQTYSSNNTATFGNFPLYLFSRAGTTSFSGGQMDDFQLFGRALSASEIQQIYSNNAADFSLTSTPASQTVVQGGGTTYTQTVTSVAGFNGDVAFSVSGLPTDATGTFNPTSVTGSGTSTLTVTSATTTPTGTYTLTITGTSGALTHSTTTTFVVNAPVPPDFTLSSTPASQSVTQGGITTYTPAVAAANGFSGAVALSVSGLPTDATGTFNPTSVTGSGTSTLTVTTATTTPTGTYTLTITGASGALTHSVAATLVVNAPAAAKFTLTATPSSRTIAAGSSTTYSVKMTTLSGFTGSVVFGVTGLPIGATGGFSRASRTSSGSTTLTVSTTSSVSPGSYPLTITGTNSGQIQTVPVTLVISGPPTAAVSPSPLDFGNVTTGTNTTLNLTVANTGTASLSGGQFTFGGGTPQPYTRITSGTFPAGAPNCGTSLAVGASCTIKVRFAPTTATTFNRTLNVAYTNATVTGSPVSLTGTGVTTSAAAILSVSPTSIDFGSVPRGSTSTTPGDITISDTGTVTLTGLTIIDPDAAHFPGTGSTCGTALAPGESCTISGVFVPGNTLGTVTTTLTISSSNGGTETVSLSGTGT
jgi:uncharacterized membrane protein